MIEKRKGWSLHVPPTPPHKPTPPREKILTFTRKWIHTAYDSCYIGDIKLPEDCSHADVYVESHVDHGDLTMDFYVVKSNETDNPDFQLELKRWNENYQQWVLDDKEYHKELVEWTEWKQQQQAIEREKELKKAEELLRRHGRLND